MLDTSKTYQSNNYGDFKVLEYINYKNVKIMFISTGYITTTQASNIDRGAVKDVFYPSIFGIGFVGKGSHKLNIDGHNTKPYSAWVNMLKRCYDKELHSKHPTYKDCSVCEEWHNFQMFAEWFELNYIEGYHLDKDIKIDGNKVYSPSSCLFVSQSENAIKANAKHFNFTTPDGYEIDVYNLSEFCRKNNLTQGEMSNVHLGKSDIHKGWTKTLSAALIDGKAYQVTHSQGSKNVVYSKLHNMFHGSVDIIDAKDCTSIQLLEVKS